jgi:cytochrome c-type biogenesis protein CcmH/NrfG
MGPAAAVPAGGGDEAKDAAARVFLAATHGRLSEARLALAALTALDAAGTQRAKNPKYLVLTGDAYFKLLRHDDALRSYDKAHALAPSDEEVASRLERVRAKVGK